MDPKKLAKIKSIQLDKYLNKSKNTFNVNIPIDLDSDVLTQQPIVEKAKVEQSVKDEKIQKHNYQLNDDFVDSQEDVSNSNNSRNNSIHNNDIEGFRECPVCLDLIEASKYKEHEEKEMQEQLAIEKRIKEMNKNDIRNNTTTTTTTSTTSTTTPNKIKKQEHLYIDQAENIDSSDEEDYKSYRKSSTINNNSNSNTYNSIPKSTINTKYSRANRLSFIGEREEIDDDFMNSFLNNNNKSNNNNNNNNSNNNNNNRNKSIKEEEEEEEIVFTQNPSKVFDKVENRRNLEDIIDLGDETYNNNSDDDKWKNKFHKPALLYGNTSSPIRSPSTYTSNNNYNNNNFNNNNNNNYNTPFKPSYSSSNTTPYKSNTYKSPTKSYRSSSTTSSPTKKKFSPFKRKFFRRSTTRGHQPRSNLKQEDYQRTIAKVKRRQESKSSTNISDQYFYSDDFVFNGDDGGGGSDLHWESATGYTFDNTFI